MTSTTSTINNHTHSHHTLIISTTCSIGHISNTLQLLCNYSKRIGSQSLLHQGISQILSAGDERLLLSPSQSLLHQGISQIRCAPGECRYKCRCHNPFYIRAYLKSELKDSESVEIALSQSLLHQGISQMYSRRANQAKASDGSQSLLHQGISQIIVGVLVSRVLTSHNPFYIRAYLKFGRVSCWPRTPEACHNPFYIRAYLKSTRT